ERASSEGGSAMVREASPDRNHLAVSCRVIVFASEIVSARQHDAVPHNHCSEWEVTLSRLVNRNAHEPLVVGQTRIANFRKRRRRQQGSACKAGDQRTSGGTERRALATTICMTTHRRDLHRNGRAGRREADSPSACRIMSGRSARQMATQL